MFDERSFDLATERSYPTPFQDSCLLPLLLMSLAVQKHTPNTKRFFRQEYDYIVVGAGTAGSVVAARLSEDPSKTVLLLEAGKSPPLLTDLPGAEFAFSRTDIFRNYFTEPQKYAAQNNENRTLMLSTGKCVGGSSVINGMLHVRGNRADYNDWDELGAHGWNWSGVFPYFLKAEDNTDLDIAHNGFHSVGGPVSVGRFPDVPELEVALRKAVCCMGYPYGDANGVRQSGFVDQQATVRRGQRVSTAKAYLVPSENRPNLDIVTEAYVTKVLITNKIAWGVQFDFEGHRHEVKARSEVILSAGAIQSPQLLMLSGIGPKTILQTFGIPVIADVPVGKNFQDHAMTFVNFYSTKDLPTLSQKLQNPSNIRKYINYRTGPLAASPGNLAMALLSDNVTAQHCDLPEYQLYLYEGPWGPDAGFWHSQETHDKLHDRYLDKPTLLCASEALLPQSIGYVSIRSRSPYDPPLIDPNFYEVREDVLRVVEGMKICYRIMESPFMKELGFKPFETMMPGCEELDDDEYLECYARRYVFSVGHYIGTVRMGDACDPDAVVDTRLRVKGIRGLRVVDASVMPKMIRGNTYFPVIMIAEKASDIIKGCY